MAAKAEVEKHLKVIVDRLNEVGPIVLEGWGGTVMYLMPDLKTGWRLKMAKDGSVESLVESTDESGIGVLQLDSDTFVGIYTNQIGASEAMADGRMKIRGGMDALVKLLPHTVG